jgi:hypothetical protein
MSRTLLRRLRWLEKVFQAREKEPYILVQMWRPKQEEDFLMMVEDAYQKLCRGEKVVIVPLGGLEILKQRGVV